MTKIIETPRVNCSTEFKADFPGRHFVGVEYWGSCSRDAPAVVLHSVAFELLNKNTVLNTKIINWLIKFRFYLPISKIYIAQLHAAGQWQSLRTMRHEKRVLPLNSLYSAAFGGMIRWKSNFRPKTADVTMSGNTQHFWSAKMDHVQIEISRCKPLYEGIKLSIVTLNYM